MPVLPASSFLVALSWGLNLGYKVTMLAGLPASLLFSLLSLSAVTLPPIVFTPGPTMEGGGAMGLSLVRLGPSLQWVLEVCCGSPAGRQRGLGSSQDPPMPSV